MKITIIGAGNGGQAMAGHFGYLGHEVSLYSRNLDKLKDIIKNRGVYLKERIDCFGKVNTITDDIKEAIKAANLIMITTVANAHSNVATMIAPHVDDNQIIVLNPGRTFGALEFRNILSKQTNKRIYIAETQSLLYACRSEGNGVVRVLGIKDNLPTAAIPSSDTEHVLSILNQIHPSFIKAENILETSLENIGCILHPAIVLFNTAKIERGEGFFFYKDMTPSIASLIESIDKERLAIGKKLGIKLMSVFDWIAFSYLGIEGDTLCERMMNNPAYFKIIAPTELKSRLLTEDIPTGVLPLIEIARAINIEVPLLTSVYNLTSGLLEVDFKKHGRTLKNLGIENIDINAFIKSV